VAAFNEQYTDNENPAIDTLSLVRADGTRVTNPPDAPGAAAVAVKPGEDVTLRATWKACPTCAGCQPAACTGAEQYVALDPATRALVTRREAIRVAWFATGGTLAEDSGGRAEGEADPPSLDNGWTAPARSGDVRLWLVVRDDRGGVGWQSYRVAVE
jgi:hypothetical protein